MNYNTTLPLSHHTTTILIVVFLLYTHPTHALDKQNNITIISYNVENLFDTRHDTLKQDSAFLPNGERHWTYTRYRQKVDQISRVIANISGQRTAAIVGLVEVENERCLKDLLFIGGLRNMGYRYIHHESPDIRGIDCALLYDPQQFHLLHEEAIPIPISTRPTRDILYAKGIVNRHDTLHILLCHMPSQLGGAAATASRREVAKSVVRHKTDSIRSTNSNANIIVMGDMNTEPQNDIEGLTNLMVPFEQQGQGTHKWQGRWSCLDQFYVSKTLQEKSEAYIYSPDYLLENDEKYLGQKPKRTYVGFKYHGGTSDHLPIVLQWTMD